MTNWVESRIQERADRRRRENLIGKGLDQIWESLHAELSRCCEDYSKGQNEEVAKVSAYTPDSITAAIERYEDTYKNMMVHRNVTLKLERQQSRVRVSYKNKDMLIAIGLNHIEQVCLLDESGAELPIREAVRRILDPLFFFDLPDVGK